MKKVEISFYEISGGKIKPVSDSFQYDLPQAFVWAMNTATSYEKANHIKIFFDSEHEDHLCFDKDENGIWSDTTIESNELREPIKPVEIDEIDEVNIKDELLKLNESISRIGNAVYLHLIETQKMRNSK